ncbi:MAG TPA: serine hydrolase [Streptosporangiaceae bacterium]|jgi:D-alanyl-D-alanine carboxypeptidase (penicillin-binding protein 5/6)
MSPGGLAQPVTVAAPAALPVGTEAGPLVTLKGADLVLPGTGTTLWSVAPDVPRPMGSIVKVMTALVVLKEGHLNREITVTKAMLRYVSKRGASTAGLIKGDVLTARQLLEAMLLPSGCDAAYLLATAYGPGRAAFIRKMNATATHIGMTATHFTSFDGMPFPTEHSTYSSPADLIKLGEQAMRYPLFRQMVSQRKFYVPKTPRHHAYLWLTTDHLLYIYKGAVGIKTGDTDAAGNCLLFEARRHGRVLIGVVLHAAPTSDPISAITAAAQVLNWGFRRLGT